MNTPNSQIKINLPREGCLTSPLNSYLELNFEVIKKTDNFIYANGNDIRLANLGHIVFFSNFKVTKSSRKHLEDSSNAKIVSLLDKLLGSVKDSDDLSIDLNVIVRG